MDTTIGLKDLYYAPITEAANGYETYGTPVRLAPVISAGLTIDSETATLDADDKIEDQFSHIKSGKLTLSISALGATAAAALTGAHIDENDALVDSEFDKAPPVAIGFRSLTSKGTYQYVWLYRVVFAPTGGSYSTKKRNENITFNSPSIEGTFTPRNKPDSKGRYPWRISCTDIETSQLVEDWFDAVPEPLWPQN